MGVEITIQDDIIPKEDKTILEHQIIAFHEKYGLNGYSELELAFMKEMLRQRDEGMREANTEMRAGLIKLNLAVNPLESSLRPITQLESRRINLFEGITGREDVNSRFFYSQLDHYLSLQGVDKNEGELILSEAFTLAFNGEMSQPILSKGVDNFNNKLSNIQKIFRENISGLSDDYRNKLIFLCIVESNFNAEVKSSAGAIGIWQIIPETGTRYYRGELDIEVALQDLEISTNIAARYLNDLISYVKYNFPNASDDEVFSMVLRQYNGAWNTRLKPEYRLDVFSSARDIYIELDMIEGVNLDTSLTEEQKISEALAIIHSIQNKYFDDSDLIGYLEDNNLNKDFDSLLRWSRRYFDKIIKQQLMYPYQIIGAHNAYQKLHSS